MLERRFSITTLKKLCEIQENTDGQFNKIRQTIHDIKKKFNEELS